MQLRDPWQKEDLKDPWDHGNDPWSGSARQDGNRGIYGHDGDQPSKERGKGKYRWKATGQKGQKRNEMGNRMQPPRISGYAAERKATRLTRADGLHGLPSHYVQYRTRCFELFGEGFKAQSIEVQVQKDIQQRGLLRCEMGEILLLRFVASGFALLEDFPSERIARTGPGP